jgi:hypothetical protein
LQIGNTKNIRYVLLYVDNTCILFCSKNTNSIEDFKVKLTSRFKAKDLDFARTFLGINIEYSNKGIKLNQSKDVSVKTSASKKLLSSLCILCW